MSYLIKYIGVGEATGPLTDTTEITWHTGDINTVDASVLSFYWPHKDVFQMVPPVAPDPVPVLAPDTTIFRHVITSYDVVPGSSVTEIPFPHSNSFKIKVNGKEITDIFSVLGSVTLFRQGDTHVEIGDEVQLVISGG